MVVQVEKKYGQRFASETFVAPGPPGFLCGEVLFGNVWSQSTACVERAGGTVDEGRASKAQLPRKVRCGAFAPCWVGMGGVSVPWRPPSNTESRSKTSNTSSVVATCAQPLQSQPPASSFVNPQGKSFVFRNCSNV